MIRPTGYVTPSGNYELIIVDSQFKGCKFYYDKVEFSDTPNPDGTMTLHFEYVITNGYVVEDTDAFRGCLGDQLCAIIEAMHDAGNIVYKGGV